MLKTINLQSGLTQYPGNYGYSIQEKAFEITTTVLPGTRASLPAAVAIVATLPEE